MRKGEFEFCDQVERFDPRLGEMGRRDFVYRFGKGLGSLALTSLLFGDGRLAAAARSENPLLPKKPHFAPKAKSCIFMFMQGAPSQMDTFDPKPKLNELHGKTHPPQVREPGKADVRGQPLHVQTARAIGSGDVRHVLRAGDLRR